MDLNSYKEKLNRLRVKELKDILRRLDLLKQGRKQDLVDRILDSLSVEVSDLQDLAKRNIMQKGVVAGIIDDAFRNLQSIEATSSSVNEESISEIDYLKPGEVVKKTVRCPCGSSLTTESMIQCVDPHCGVLQHMSCVIATNELPEEITPLRHYCEICRLNRSDPFRVTLTHLLPPVKLRTLSIPHDGSNPVQNVEKTFQLCKTDKLLLCHNDINIQAWCILLNDKVQFRMQWPLYADLKVNGVPVRTVTRPGSQLLGANGRDDGSMIAFYMVDGLNQISLSGWDPRNFCFGVRVVKENTVQKILEVVLNAQHAETFEDALGRVQRCIGGGVAMTTEDSDSDLEVISDFVTVNLRCPMGGYRIKTAGRFRQCAHMGCFDLETFLQLNQRSRKWQCPICLKNYCLEDITVDPYLNCITKMVEDCEEDVTEIDVKVDGCWRVKKGGELKNLDQWRLPDGSQCESATEAISNPAALKKLKLQEIDGNINDFKQGEHFGSFTEGGLKPSNSDCEGLDGGKHSVNQNAVLTNFTTIVGNSSAAPDNMDIIILSDSDDEAPIIMYPPEPASKPQGVNNDGHVVSSPRIPNSIAESLTCDVGLGSLKVIFSCNDNQTLSSGTQGCDMNPVQSSSHKSPCVPMQSENLFDHEISNGTVQENSTLFGGGSNSGGVNGVSEAHCEVSTSGGQEFLKPCIFNEDLSANKIIRSELTTDIEQSNGPFSFPRRARSAKRRYIP